MIYSDTYKTPIGFISISANDSSITKLSFGKDENINKSELTEKAFMQLFEYFEGKRFSFDLPLYYNGTIFQNNVWRELLKIPYGKVISYKELAVRIGKDKACRAVGMANNKNPLPVLIPCHRVIGSNNKLIGYGGGLEIKKALLDLEAKYVLGER